MQVAVPSVAPAVVACLLSWSSAAETTVTVSKSDDIFLVEAQSRVVADREIAWAVLTGYEDYPGFVPNLTVSRRISSQPLRIEQVGEFGILFFRKKVHSTLQIEEHPQTRIFFRAIGGDLRTLETEVKVLQEDASVVVSYRSVIEPDFWVPPLIGAQILRASIRTKLSAVADEIERRVKTGITR